jgi:hypothetical protein
VLLDSDFVGVVKIVRHIQSSSIALSVLLRIASRTLYSAELDVSFLGLLGHFAGLWSHLVRLLQVVQIWVRV